MRCSVYVSTDATRTLTEGCLARADALQLSLNLFLLCFVSAKERGASSIMREKWRKKRMRRLKRKRRAQKK
ncbi:unnamed protein product [Haemonchus placei]|uniref:60S ribosomal protein L41 n=1 Tax=Haemonchus placei TaxID=6290 RepID=A0A0N4X950_HAEPC|nr:unnamed protein product [Haemonchus placei]